MKVYLINLDKDTNKLQFIDSQLRELGVSYTRIPGIYGKSLTKKERLTSVNNFRWWCAVGRPVAPAEIGCALSHYKIYRQIAGDEKSLMCCILEDDVKLSPQFKLVLEQVEKWIDPSRPQVVLLNDHMKKYQCLPCGIHISRFGGTCADGYVLTRTAAINLLKANLPIVVPCDTWSRWVRQGQIELYHAVPTVVEQMQGTFGSSTSEGRKVLSKKPIPFRILYKVKRTLGKIIDLTLIKMMGR